MSNPMFYSALEEEYLRNIDNFDSSNFYCRDDGNVFYVNYHGNDGYDGYDGSDDSSIFWSLTCLFVLMPATFVASALFVSVFVWKPIIEAGERAYQRDLSRIENIKNKYENKYPLPKDKREGGGEGGGGEEEEEDDETKTLKMSIVMENVPDLGNVIMRFNGEKTGFEYWADRTIPHRYLCTVARKYVNSFNKYTIYTPEGEATFDESEDSVGDNDDEVSVDEEGSESSGLESGSGSESESESESEKKEESPPQTNSVFATYKNYKTTSKGDDANSVKKAKQGITPVNKKINTFFYQGKINNFNVLSKPVDEETQEEKSWYVPVSFADFKKIGGGSA